MNTTLRMSAALLAIAATTSLAACGDDTPQARTPTVTATVTASASATDAATDSGAGTGDDTDTTASDVATDAASGPGAAVSPTPTEACGPKTLPPATVNAAIAKIPTDGPSYAWQTGDSNFSTCNTISYVVLDTVGATGSSPQQLMIFDQNARFLGTGIKCNAGFQKVIKSTSDSITVQYGYIKPGESTAGASGRVVVSFRWNGSSVVMDGSLPYEVTQGRC